MYIREIIPFDIHPRIISIKVNLRRIIETNMILNIYFFLN